MSEFKVKYRGVRGSYPIANKDFLQYGGNTSCVEINVNGHLIILDAGTGLIDIGEILDAEFDNSESYHHKAIIFCDKDNVVCVYNSKNDSYFEDGYEYFEPAEQRLYIRCNSDASYEALKNFINQSSKYHNFAKYEYEIPRKKAFEKMFTANDSVIDDIKDK